MYKSNITILFLTTLLSIMFVNNVYSLHLPPQYSKYNYINRNNENVTADQFLYLIEGMSIEEFCNCFPCFCCECADGTKRIKGKGCDFSKVCCEGTPGEHILTWNSCENEPSCPICCNGEAWCCECIEAGKGIIRISGSINYYPTQKLIDQVNNYLENLIVTNTIRICKCEKLANPLDNTSEYNCDCNSAECYYWKFIGCMDSQENQNLLVFFKTVNMGISYDREPITNPNICLNSSVKNCGTTGSGVNNGK